MIVGIDLGTTNSAVAAWIDDAPRLLPNSLGHVLTPSAVGLDDSGEVLVGLSARERQVTHPWLTATSFKRYMGSSRETRLGTRSFSPEELSALVLRRLKSDAEAALGTTVTGAIITVPAYFNDRQRKATRRAGELAGLNVERLINEPTAAALAYGIHRLDAEPRFLVFDLGGGTFDVSLLEIFEGVIEVRASTGDNFLGGDDFNDVLVDRFFKAHSSAFRERRRDENPKLHHRMRDAAERTRRALSSQSEATMQISWHDRTLELPVTQDEFERMAEPLLARLREPVARALRDARVAAESLTEVVLIGGATRMPIVRRAVARLFGRFPAATINPDEAVALGAAVQVGLKTRAAALREVVLTDVCPYSLGVDTAITLPDGSLKPGVFAPVIERNTVVPASRMRRFSTIRDGQRVVEFGVFQGESRDVKDNVPLGSIKIDVPPKRAGEVAIDCRFSYDINGLLEVDVLVPETGQRRELVIQDGEAAIDSAELASRRAALAELKVHPREVDANRALLARAHRCFEQALGAERDQLSAVIGAFEATLERQDPREIERVAGEFAVLLDRFEGATYL